MRATERISCPLLCLELLPLIVLTPLSSVSWAAPSDAYGIRVQNQCGFTRYPILCVETLMPLKMGNGSFEDGTATSALVKKTISETERNVSPPQSNLTRLMVGYSKSDALHAKAVSDQCEELITLSLRRLRQSLKALRTSPVKSKFDIQTWLSAVITLQESCKDSADGPRSKVISRLSPMIEISMKMDYLSKLASNSLALANRIKSKGLNTADSRGDTGHEFPRWVTEKQRRLLQGAGSSSGGIEANVVVAQDGSGDYTTVSDAISAASSHGGRFVIYVKAGVYKEKIHCKRDALTLIGDGKYSTIIAGDDSVASGSTLLGSTTFTISGLQ
ncbi:hypothetical protein MLD38_015108 [Melastoma candidum]|uniref:Uncharacterized protein n=1 Tax=Melastoma candidum TaxID=119954 RepID=A0ACB9RIR0_9MYRT|nr:hypothetical protein MLD38_015108 [Melastoma candidum]